MRKMTQTQIDRWNDMSERLGEVPIVEDIQALRVECQRLGISISPTEDVEIDWRQLDHLVVEGIDGSFRVL